MNNWNKVKLGDISTQIRGVSYKPADVLTEESDISSTLLRANNIFEDNINYDELVFVKRERVSNEQYLKKGDILICASSGSKHLVGKAACFNDDRKVSFGAFCKVVRPHDVEFEYLKHYFFSPTYRQLISAASEGANINNIKTEDLENLEIPLPPIETQKQIAATLDKVTKIIAENKKLLTQYDLLIKSRFIEMFGDIKQYEKLSSFSTLITKGASPRWQGIEYTDEGTLFVTSENVRERFIDYSKKKYLPNSINELLPRSILKKNDVLINIVGASIGRAAIFDSDLLANINQAVALVRLDSNKINELYLVTYLNSEKALKMYSEMKKGGARDNLSLQNIADLKIPVCDVTLQQQFAAFVQQIDKSKFVVQKSLEKAETLYKSLMQEYFG